MKRRDGCVAKANRAAQLDKKFGPRTMKSLRKTILMAATLFPQFWASI